MRRLLAIALGAVACGALAQTPPKLEPLPETPPPPPGVESLTPSEPSVTIQQREKGQQVDEVREGGRVVALKVTPKDGPPYYLVDPTGNGHWVRRNSIEPIAVPQWPLKTWQ